MIMKGKFIPRKKIGAFGIHCIYGFTQVLINKDLEMQRLAKTNDKNRRFGVNMTPLSRRNKE